MIEEVIEIVILMLDKEVVKEVIIKVEENELDIIKENKVGIEEVIEEKINFVKKFVMPMSRFIVASNVVLVVKK